MTFGNWKHEQCPDTRVSDAGDFAKRHPNLIFLPQEED
jgi:hypothetical protein